MFSFLYVRNACCNVGPQLRSHASSRSSSAGIMKLRKTDRWADSQYIITKFYVKTNEKCFFPFVQECRCQRRTAAQIARKFAVKFSGDSDIKKD